jgi:hypothetical protein
MRVISTSAQPQFGSVLADEEEILIKLLLEPLKLTLQVLQFILSARLATAFLHGLLFQGVLLSFAFYGLNYITYKFTLLMTALNERLVVKQLVKYLLLFLFAASLTLQFLQSFFQFRCFSVLTLELCAQLLHDCLLFQLLG